MANVRIFKVDWYNGKPIVTGGGYQLAYQGDDMSNMVIFDKAPNLDNYYLVVKMKLDEADTELTTLPPIQLEGPYWVVPNYYTQIAQTITFQCCCRTPQGDYEHHSAWFTGAILPTIKHNGDPIDQSPMFDPYMDILNKRVSELILTADVTEIDNALDENSTNPIQNKIITGALAEVDERLTTLEEGGASTSGINDAVIYYLQKVLESALFKTDASMDIQTLINALKGQDGIIRDGETLIVNYLLNDTATASAGYVTIT